MTVFLSSGKADLLLGFELAAKNCTKNGILIKKNLFEESELFYN